MDEEECWQSFEFEWMLKKELDGGSKIIEGEGETCGRIYTFERH